MNNNLSNQTKHTQSYFLQPPGKANFTSISWVLSRLCVLSLPTLRDKLSVLGQIAVFVSLTEAITGAVACRKGDCCLYLLVPGPVLHDVGRHVDVLHQGQQEASLPVSLSRPGSTGQEAVDQLAQRALQAQHQASHGGLLQLLGKRDRERMGQLINSTIRARILHTGNTWLSCMSVILEYRYIPWVLVNTMDVVYTISTSLYHKSMSIQWVHVYTISPCLYNESMSIQWVHVYTMSPRLYNESMSIRWVPIYTMSPCLYNESPSIQWVHVYTMSPCQYHASLSIPVIHVYTMSPCQ